jgi:hypothetical protein
MGSITKSGSEILRRYLIHGARSVLMHAHKSDDPNLKWALKLKDRIGMNKATVALAHRMARVSICVLRDEMTYGEIKKKSSGRCCKKQDVFLRVRIFEKRITTLGIDLEKPQRFQTLIYLRERIPEAMIIKNVRDNKSDHE